MNEEFKQLSKKEAHELCANLMRDNYRMQEALRAIIEPSTLCPEVLVNVYREIANLALEECEEYEEECEH
jgi:hypothetical protein